MSELFDRAARVIPGGVNSPVRAFRSVGGEPYFVECGKGAYVWDTQGKRYVDYVQSYGPTILGHAHSAVVNALAEAARKAPVTAPRPSEKCCWQKKSATGSAVWKWCA